MSTLHDRVTPPPAEAEPVTFTLTGSRDAVARMLTTIEKVAELEAVSDPQPSGVSNVRVVGRAYRRYPVTGGGR